MLFQAQYALGVLRLLTADRQIRSSVGSSALEAERASSLLGQAISHPRDTRVDISGSLGGTDCFWNGRANGHYSSVHASEEVFVRASRRSLFVPPRRSSFLPLRRPPGGLCFVLGVADSECAGVLSPWAAVESWKALPCQGIGGHRFRELTCVCSA